MRLITLAKAALLPLVAQSINIIQSNDDGWAEVNLRTFFNKLTSAGHNAVISSPAKNYNGAGSADLDPQFVSEGCQYGSCPPGSPAIGGNVSQPKINWVNSFPATAMRKGIEEVARPFFNNRSADLAVTGPNAGPNLGFAVVLSGTVGAAVMAVSRGVPALAFSGVSGNQTAWNVNPVPVHSKVYADLAWDVTDRIIKSGSPYLPPDTFLNVNFAPANETRCSSASQYKFVFTRILSSFEERPDVNICGNGGLLPSETSVIEASSNGGACIATISAGRASSKSDANSTVQAVVMKKLGDLVTCLPKPCSY